MKLNVIIILSIFMMMYSCDDTQEILDVDDSAVELNIEKLDVLELGDSDQ